MARFRSGSLIHGKLFLKNFMKNILPSADAQPMIDAIRSGEVYCHCYVDREAEVLKHDAGCLWQRYMEGIYRIGRAEDALQADQVRKLNEMEEAYDPMQYEKKSKEDSNNLHEEGKLR